MMKIEERMDGRLEGRSGRGKGKERRGKKEEAA